MYILYKNDVTFLFPKQTCINDKVRFSTTLLLFVNLVSKNFLNTDFIYKNMRIL